MHAFSTAFLKLTSGCKFRINNSLMYSSGGCVLCVCVCVGGGGGGGTHNYKVFCNCKNDKIHRSTCLGSNTWHTCLRCNFSSLDRRRFTTICDYSSLFATIRHYSRLLVTIRDDSATSCDYSRPFNDYSRPFVTICDYSHYSLVAIWVF